MWTLSPGMDMVTLPHGVVLYGPIWSLSLSLPLSLYVPI